MHILIAKNLLELISHFSVLNSHFSILFTVCYMYALYARMGGGGGGGGGARICFCAKVSLFYDVIMQHNERFII